MTKATKVCNQRLLGSAVVKKQRRGFEHMCSVDAGEKHPFHKCQCGFVWIDYRHSTGVQIGVLLEEGKQGKGNKCGIPYYE